MQTLKIFFTAGQLRKLMLEFLGLIYVDFRKSMHKASNYNVCQLSSVDVPLNR